MPADAHLTVDEFNGTSRTTWATEPPAALVWLLHLTSYGPTIINEMVPSSAYRRGVLGSHDLRGPESDQKMEVVAQRRSTANITKSPNARPTCDIMRPVGRDTSHQQNAANINDPKAFRRWGEKHRAWSSLTRAPNDARGVGVANLTTSGRVSCPGGVWPLGRSIAHVAWCTFAISTTPLAVR